jgi:GNAT superfamily N-acetyltransferase
MRKTAAALPVGDYLDNPRMVLRDGTVASVRVATDSDREPLRRFFHDLSPESRRRRFFTPAEPTDAIVQRLTEAHDPGRALTLIVDRYVSAEEEAASPAGRLRPIATASYLAVSDRVAEAAFAVDDRFQGKGLGSMLLERLAVIAARHGFERFQASTLTDNTPMLEVFRDSGFEIRSKSSGGCVDLQLSLTPSAEGVRAAEERDRAATAASLRPMLAPAAVAVVGASRDPSSIGRRVLDALRAAGFKGPIYPVNPNAAELDGLVCYPSARQLPAGTDLAVIAVPSKN